MSGGPAPRPTRRRPDRRQGGVLQTLLSLTAPQQRTAAAAVVVLVSLGTPWYSTEVVFPGVDGGAPRTSSGTMTGISAFSFVEAAVLLVAAAVLVLVWGRATERSFSLPVSDGTVVTAAAGWLGLLVVYRLFDRPDGDADGGAATLIGLSWGIFASLAAVGLLLTTGLDQRRRDAELRSSIVGPADGPVVDPADVVATGAGGPGPPAPRDPPSRRRPTPPEDATHPLDRDAAAALLRDVGLRGEAAPRTRAEDRHAPRDDDPTRATPGGTDPTRVAPRGTDPTRVSPGSDRRADLAPPPPDARLRGGRRRGDRDGT